MYVPIPLFALCFAFPVDRLNWAVMQTGYTVFALMLKVRFPIFHTDIVGGADLLTCRAADTGGRDGEMLVAVPAWTKLVYQAVH